MSCFIKYKENSNEFDVIDKQGNPSKTYDDLLLRGYSQLEALHLLEFANSSLFKDISTEISADELLAYIKVIPYKDVLKFKSNECSSEYNKSSEKSILQSLKRKYPNLAKFISFRRKGENTITPYLTIDGKHYAQLDSVSNNTEAENKELNEKLKGLLESIGVQTDYLENHPVYSKMPLVGLADMMRNIVYTSFNKSNITTLPEEASHFFLEFLKQQGNPLYNSMMNDIVKYDEFQQVLQEYGKLKEYQLEDGSLNYEKLKEEAVGKVLSKRIINGFTTTEYKEKRVTNWFDKVLDFFNKFIGNRGFTNETDIDNYFTTTADKILKGEFTGSLGKKKEENVLFQLPDNSSEVQSILDKLIKRDSEIVDEQELNSYGVYQKVKYIIKDGVKKRIKRVSDIINPNSYTGAATKEDDAKLKMESEFGTKVHNDFQYHFNDIVANPDTTIKPNFGGIVKNKILSFKNRLLKEFPVEDFIYLSEIKLHDDKLSGTIDLTIINRKTGETSIFDYKNIAGLDNYGISEKKSKDWTTQLSEYKNLLKTYGVKSFYQARMIPININYNYKLGEADLKSFDVPLNNVVRSDSNVNARPLVSERVKGNEKLNKVLDLLEDKLRTYIRTGQTDKVKRLRDTIAKTQVGQSYDYIGEQASIDRNIIQDLIKFEDNDDGTITLPDINTFDVSNRENIILLNEFMKYYKDDVIYKSLPDSPDSVARLYSDFATLQPFIENLMNKAMLEENIDENLVVKPTKWWDRLYKLSEQDNPIFQAFYRLLVKVTAEKDNKVDKLKENVKKYIEQAKNETGIKDETLYDVLYQKDKNGKNTPKLITAKNAKWFDFHAQNKSSLFVGKGIDISHLKNSVFGNILDYDLFSKDYIEAIKKLDISIDGLNPETQESLRLQERKKWLNKLNANSIYFNIESSDFVSKGFLNDVYKTEIIDKKDSGLAKLYHIMVDLNKFANKNCDANLGSNVLLPYVKKGLAQIALNSPKKYLGAIQSGLQLAEWETYELDSKGNKIYKIPLLHNASIGSRDLAAQSYDLGELILTWGDAVYTNDLLNKSHDSSLLLYEKLKRSKQMIFKNGKVVKDDTGIRTTDTDKSTLEAFDDYHKQFFYGVNTKEDDFTIIGNLSGQKTTKAVMQYFSAKQLGFNVFSALGNLTGGAINTIAYSGNHFKRLDMLKVVKKMGSNDAKTYALMKAFDIDTNIYEKNQHKDVSMSKVNKYFTLDKLFLLQKKGDWVMQNNILGAMTHNYTIDNGIIRIKKEGEKSMYEQVSIDKDGKVSLPVSELEFFRFREKVRGVTSNIIGNTSELDKTRASSTFTGQLLLQYRRWMLPLGTARFGDLRYNASLDEFQIGKFNASWKILSASVKERNIKILTDFVTNAKSGSLDAFLYEEYEKALEINPKLGNFEDFKKLYSQGLYSTTTELMVIGALIALKGMLDDEDDSPVAKGFNRVLSRSIAEGSFWLVPANFTKILSSPIPLVNHLSSFLELMTLPITTLFGDKEFLEGGGKLLRKNVPFFSAWDSFNDTMTKAK